MKVISNRLLAASCASVLILSACGGSSDDGAGSLTAFSASPASKSVTGPVGACYSGYVGRFFVSGGVPPYRVELSDPDVFSFTDPTLGPMTGSASVSNRDGSFDLWSVAVCVNPSSAVIFDNSGGGAGGRRFEVELTNAQGS